jgi:hypothetical protein
MRMYEGDPGRVCSVFPGRGYTPDRSLLYYCRMLLLDRGWTVREIWWADGDKTSSEAALAQAREELDAVSSGLHLVVAKSLGSFTLPLAVERSLPGVWLTPILTESLIATAARDLSAPSLLVGGTKDRLWDGAVARQSAADVLELDGANHSLELGESVGPSLAALQQVVGRVTTFVDRLGR